MSGTSPRDVPRLQRRRRAGRVDVAAGLLAGYAADRLLGDPRRHHPVAGIGLLAGHLESRMYRDSRTAGAVFAGLAGGAAGGVAYALRRCADSGPATTLLTAVVTWAALGGTSLTRIGGSVADALDRADVDDARGWIPSLCGRDPESLDEAGIVRATLESIAENTSDATVAPLFWGAVAGMPGVIAYRTINTLDAMVGYRNERYTRFGWAAARLDDLANVVPARATGLLVAALGSAPAQTVTAWRRDARRHPSPNAGVVEASFAGALGVSLGGRTVYPHGVEERPLLGDGPAPTDDDLRAAVALSRRVQVGAAVGAAGLALLISRRSVR